MMIRLLILIISILVLPEAHSADYYVRSSAAHPGDGLSWATAWGDFDHVVWPSGENTVWIAGGTYSEYLDIATGGTDNTHRLSIMRIRSTDPQCDAACVSGGYDSQVILTSSNWCAIQMGNGANNITIDGRIADGIRIERSAAQAGIADLGYPKSNVTLRYIEIEGPGKIDYGSSDQFHIDFTPSSGVTSNILLEYLNLHATTEGIKTARGNGIVFQYSHIHHLEMLAGSTHPNAWYDSNSSNVTVRWNEFDNYEAEGILMNGGGDNWDIYGNIFYNASRAFEDSESVGATNIKFYNNTLDTMPIGVRILNPGSTLQFINNAARAVGGDGNTPYTAVSGATITASNNWSHATSDPGWVNRESSNYALTSSAIGLIDMGTDLGSSYSLDKAGTPRGTAWDIGAYEYFNATNSFKGRVTGNMSGSVR